MHIALDYYEGALHPYQGMGRYARKLAEHLTRLGGPHTCTLLTPARAEGPPGPCQARPLPLPLRAKRALWLLSHLARLPLDRLVGPCDLFHATDAVAPYLAGAPTVLTVHDLAAWVYPKALPAAHRLYLRLALPLAARRAAAIVCVSHHTAAEVKRLLGVPPERVRVVPNGVDGAFGPPTAPEDVAAARKKYGLPARYLLVVGALEPRKNLPTLLAAFARLLAMGAQDFALAVVGPKGWGYGDSLRQLARPPWEGRVFLLGCVGDADLRPLYAGAAAFVFPSLYEGFGLPPLEAMACGTPVVCSNASSLPEVVGDAALLVEPRDTAGLAHAIAAVLNDEALARELAARGLARAKLFSWRRTAEETLKVYREACAEGRQAGAEAPSDMRVSP